MGEGLERAPRFVFMRSASLGEALDDADAVFTAPVDFRLLIQI